MATALASRQSAEKWSSTRPSRETVSLTWSALVSEEKTSSFWAKPATQATLSILLEEEQDVTAFAGQASPAKHSQTNPTRNDPPSKSRIPSPRSSSSKRYWKRSRRISSRESKI